jgi:hypothetical protein
MNAPFNQQLDPERIRALHDDRIDMWEWLIARATPDRPSPSWASIAVSVAAVLCLWMFLFALDGGWL